MGQVRIEIGYNSSRLHEIELGPNSSSYQITLCELPSRMTVGDLREGFNSDKILAVDRSTGRLIVPKEEDLLGENIRYIIGRETGDSRYTPESIERGIADFGGIVLPKPDQVPEDPSFRENPRFKKMLENWLS